MNGEPTMTTDHRNEIEATDTEEHVHEHTDTMNAGSRLLLSVEEAADVLRLGRTRTYELVMTRKIQSVKVGRRRLVVGSSLVEFVRTLLQEQEFG